MATYHCSVKVGKTGTGYAHAAYIVRDGKYSSKDKSDLEHIEFGNMPAWVESASDFWKAADKHERANGSVYREYEIALPRELTKDQRLELVKDFIAQEIGNDKTYTFAIHNPRAMIDGGEQPHAHIMFSERLQDGIQRTRETHFKRYNAKDPSKGGCKKDNPSKTPAERKADLVALRERFATLQNDHLERAGQGARVTHLSLAAQGNEREPEPHLGPKVAQALASEVKELRQEIKKNPKHWRDMDLAAEEEKRALIAELYKNKAMFEARPVAPAPMSQPKPKPVAPPPPKPIEKVYTDAEAIELAKRVIKERAQEQQRLQREQLALYERTTMQQKWLDEYRQRGRQVLVQLEKLGAKPLLIGRKQWEEQDQKLSAEFLTLKGKDEQAQSTIEANKRRLEEVKAASSSDAITDAAIKNLGLSKGEMLAASRGAELLAEQAKRREQEKQAAIQEQERLKALQRAQEPEPTPKRPSRGFDLGM